MCPIISVAAYRPLCITGDGTFTWVQGVAAEYNAKAPSVPETVLALCSVKQTWREASARVVQNDGVRVVAFSDMGLWPPVWSTPCRKLPGSAWKRT
jgi:hypothetical protein